MHALLVIRSHALTAAVSACTLQTTAIKEVQEPELLYGAKGFYPLRRFHLTHAIPQVRSLLVSGQSRLERSALHPVSLRFIWCM